MEEFQKPLKEKQISGFKLIFLVSLLFLIPGSYQLMLGCVKLRDIFIFKTSVVTDINDIQPGTLVKSVFEPVPEVLVKSPVSNKQCILYRIEFYRDAGSTIGRASTMAPDKLMLQTGSEKFLVSLEDPSAKVIIKNDQLFIKSPDSDQFFPVKEIKVGSKKQITSEMLIMPDDRVMVYGRLNNIENTTFSGVSVKRLSFVRQTLNGDRFYESYKNILLALFLNKNTLYILSSKTVDDTEDDFSYAEGLLSFTIGLILCLIPIVLLLTGRGAARFLPASISSKEPSNKTQIH